MAANAFCYRHPAQTARRYCFHCRRSICQNCQIKLDHHLFCGDSCHQQYVQAITLDPKNSILRYAFYATLLLLLSFLVYFGLLADTFYDGGNRQALHSLKFSLPVTVDQNANPQISITSPVNGEKSDSGRINVEGLAPQNSDISLYLNGVLLDKTTTNQGPYRFPEIVLTRRANVIQTRYFANGASEASTPIMVFCKTLMK